MSVDCPILPLVRDVGWLSLVVMAEADAPMGHRATASVLGPAIDEVRWQFPEMRVVCAAFMGPSVCVLADSQPPTMPSLAGRRVEGAAVAALVELLETGDEFVVADVSARVGWRAISSAFLGDETRATAIIPLRLEGELVGFLRLDAPHVQSITRSAVESLHDVAPTATLAVALERECSAAREQQARSQAALQREVGHELQRAVVGLRQMVDRVTPRIEAGARIELDAIIRRFTASVEAAAVALADSPSRQSELRETLPAPCGTGPASSWSTDGTRG